MKMFKIAKAQKPWKFSFLDARRCKRNMIFWVWIFTWICEKKYFHLYILEQAAWLIRGTLAARRHSPRTFFLAEGVWIWWWDDVIGFANDLCWFVICRTHRALCRHTSLLWLTFVYDGRIFVFVHVPGHGHVFGMYLYHQVVFMIKAQGLSHTNHLSRRAKIFRSKNFESYAIPANRPTLFN